MILRSLWFKVHYFTKLYVLNFHAFLKPSQTEKRKRLCLANTHFPSLRARYAYFLCVHFISFVFPRLASAAYTSFASWLAHLITCQIWFCNTDRKSLRQSRMTRDWFPNVLTSGAYMDFPICSHKKAYSTLLNPAPYLTSGSVSRGINRFHNPAERAFCCETRIKTEKPNPRGAWHFSQTDPHLIQYVLVSH